MPKKGKVYIVGAGPGNLGLISVKATQALSKADIVIHDELVNSGFGKYLSDKAKIIYAGKKAGQNNITQNQINHLLVKHAKLGSCVVRLKGGDPYLFGRGAEEGEFLHKHKISFEVVPGISSALGCSTYAGIPLTHRELGSSVVFLTAHHANFNEKLIDWSSLFKNIDTIVIYMGATKISQLYSQFESSNINMNTQIAITQWGTFDKQKTWTGKLKDLKTKKSHIKSPAILIIGKVVSLQKKLNWFEKLKLYGKTIVITRAKNQSSKLKQKLEDLGAQIIEFPVIEIHPPKSFKKIDQSIESIDSYDWIVFLSVNGVESFLSRLFKLKKDVRTLAGVRVAAIGKATSEKLLSNGIQCDFLPKKSTSKTLINELIDRYKLTQKHKILVIRPDSVTPIKSKRGVDVDEVSSYQNKLPSNDRIKFAINEINQKKPDAIIFTSSSTVERCNQLLKAHKLINLLKKVKCISIGPITSGAMKKHKIKVHQESKFSSIDYLVQATEKVLK